VDPIRSSRAKVPRELPVDQRLTGLAEGRPGALAEDRVTFAEIAAAYMDERTLKGVPAAQLQWSRARVFTLALQAGRLSRRPYIPRLPESQPRQGFMGRDEYRAVRSHLPPQHQDVLDFGYLTGWRRGEVLSLEWSDVDRPGGVIRLRPERSKTREGRVLVLSKPLRDLIERRWGRRFLDCPLVFHRDGYSLEHHTSTSLHRRRRPTARALLAKDAR